MCTARSTKHTLLFSFVCVLGLFRFARIGPILVPCCRSADEHEQRYMKTPLHVSRKAVEIALSETRREASTSVLPLQGAVTFETPSLSTTALQRKLSFSALDFSPLHQSHAHSRHRYYSRNHPAETKKSEKIPLSQNSPPPVSA